MKKFTEIRKVYEQEITLDNMSINTDDQNKDDDVNKTETEVEVEITKPSDSTEIVTVETEIKNVEPIQPDLNTELTNDEEVKPVGDVKDFFSKLFEARGVAHIYHLTVNSEEGSFAAHVALGDYYENLLPMVDDLIETYMGQYDLITEYKAIDTNVTQSKDKVAYFGELAVYIKEAKKCINVEDTHLHNIIDEIVAITYKLLYKLRFNK